MKLLLQFISFALVASLALNSCKKDNSKFSPSSIQLKIELSHTVDGSPVELDTIKYFNEAGNQYSVINLKYFISDICLYKGGDKILLKDIHYVDISDSQTLSIEPELTISNGSYDSITFVFGLDTLRNITGFFVNPPESNMEWPIPMGGGYHYMKLEGKYDSAGVTTKNYNVHTGATMGMPYHINISLNGSTFMANGNNLSAYIEMNINKWFTNPNTYNFITYGEGIMGNSTAQQVLKQNGHDVFSLKTIN